MTRPHGLLAALCGGIAASVAMRGAAGLAVPLAVGAGAVAAGSAGRVRWTAIGLILSLAGWW